MIILKTERELELMRPACRIAAQVLEKVCRFINPGLTTKEIDNYAADQIRLLGAKSAFLGYRGYPCHVCLSVNEQVVHGLAGSRRLMFGDIVIIDVGVSFNGYIGDNARTVPVGGCSAGIQSLMDVTEKALYLGIEQARMGNRVSDISRAVQRQVEAHGYSVVREFVGHGVGKLMHEEPQIPNHVEGNNSPRLRPGMTIAIEPMVNVGSAQVLVQSDGWTVVTRDGLPSAHFEHTVLVTEDEPEIMTCLTEG